jgi:hypothetical protein
LDPALRVKSMFAAKDAWTAEEATPYLERFVVASLLMHDNDNDGGGADDGRGLPNCRSTTTTTLVANLLGRHAWEMTVGGVGGISVTKFVVK